MAKTIRVKFLLDKANAFLQNSDPTESEKRKGVIGFIEITLSEACVYAGYGYTAEFPFDSGDDTRRYYYYHSSLREAFSS